MYAFALYLFDQATPTNCGSECKFNCQMKPYTVGVITQTKNGTLIHHIPCVTRDHLIYHASKIDPANIKPVLVNTFVRIDCSFSKHFVSDRDCANIVCEETLENIHVLLNRRVRFESAPFCTHDFRIVFRDSHDFERVRKIINSNRGVSN